MASPHANMVDDDDDETQTLDASQLEDKTEAQGGLLTFCPMDRVLIPVPGETYGGSSGRPWSIYLTETEKQDKEMVERWKGEADSALIFVCAGPTILYVFPFSSKCSRLVCSRLSSQSPSLKATSGYLLIHPP